MRRALFVGIDAYDDLPSLRSCVSDAERMEQALSRHDDGSINFECKSLLAPGRRVGKADLRGMLKGTFASPAEAALFYFAGHGSVDSQLGGYLATQDAKPNDVGVSMQEVLSLANTAPISEVTIILDCCHAGAFAEVPALTQNIIHLHEGVSVLTGSRSTQSAREVGDAGVFTSLLYEALLGGAADVRGNVTVAAVYAYADAAIGSWGARPMFKAHVSSFVPLRRCKPAIETEILRQLPSYFHSPEEEFQLDPNYEPAYQPDVQGEERGKEEKEKIFLQLQKYRAAGLVEPVDEDHMYYAAINSKSCRLTPLGKFYWMLAESSKL